MKLAPPSEALPASVITILISGFFRNISSTRQQLSPSFSVDWVGVLTSAVSGACGSALKSELVALYWNAGASSEDDVVGRLELSKEGWGWWD